MPLILSIFASFHKSSPGPLVITPKESHDLSSPQDLDIINRVLKNQSSWQIDKTYGILNARSIRRFQTV